MALGFVAFALGLSADGDAGGSAGDRQRSAESVRCILSRMELQVCRRIASLVEKVCLHWDLQLMTDPSCFFARISSFTLELITCFRV